MKILTLLSLLALSATSLAIHNGHVVEPNSIPYQVLLLVKKGNHISTCGGALIKPDRVLTAAHCLKDRDSAEVFVGAHHLHGRGEKTRQRQAVDASALVPHPVWKPGAGHDIGMVILPEPFELNDVVQLVDLPYGYEDDDFDGKIAKVSGWGNIDDDPKDHVGPLRATENPVISNEHCGKIFSIDGGNICLSSRNGRRTCKGDSGSPLVTKVDDKLIQIGITSNGAKKCDTHEPSVFTRVTSYMDFIKENL
jgi:secreted trypsin-like serine protease